MSEHRIHDVHRRIRNILAVCPASDWTLEESQQVLAVLAQIVRAREARGDVIDLGA